MAADIQAYQAEQQQVNEDFVPERSVFVILKDFEQQACITLMLWAVFIIGMKTQQTVRQRSLLERTLVQVKEGMSVLPEDSRNYARPVQALPEQEQAYLLPALCWLACTVSRAPQHSGCCSDDKRCL